MIFVVDLDEILSRSGTRKKFCEDNGIDYQDYCLLMHSIKNGKSKFTYGSKNDKVSKKLISLGVAKFEKTQETV